MASFFLNMSQNLITGRNLLKQIRWFSDAVSRERQKLKKGLVIGIYSDTNTHDFKFTQAGLRFNNESGGKLEELLKESILLGKGQVNSYHNLHDEYQAVAVVNLGPADVKYSSLEILDENAENIRVAAATAAIALQKEGIGAIDLEGMGDPESAAEGATLALWKFQALKMKENLEIIPPIELYAEGDTEAFQRGMFKGEAQNFARYLSDTPSNFMTPAIFAQHAVDFLCPCGVSVEVRDKTWARAKKMFAFLAVARGSTEPPVFLEISYCGASSEVKPIVLAGKGVTYDTGGLKIKKSMDMASYHADMAGAAVILAVMRAVSAMSLPINIQAVIPLCENMPSGMAMKPGDVIVGLNGKTIQIDNTDNEGQLLLADALCYAYYHFRPKLIIDIATMTGGMKSALGNAATGVFTNNNEMWEQMRKAGSITGDRVWRFPLWNFFTRKVRDIPSADVSNEGWGPGGRPCLAAAFLNEFIPCGDWVHMDIASSGMLADTFELPYLEEGRMTGRPTRTLIQFLLHLACPNLEIKKE